MSCSSLQIHLTDYLGHTISGSKIALSVKKVLSKEVEMWGIVGSILMVFIFPIKKISGRAAHH